MPAESKNESQLVPEADYREAIKELSQIKAKFELAEADKKRLQKEVSRLKGNIGTEATLRDNSGSVITTNPPNVAPTISDAPLTNAKEAGGHHDLSWFPQYCPGDPTGQSCRTKDEARNPNFKDEVRCTGCGMHLGAVEQIATEKNPRAPIQRCPSCGDEHFYKIK